MTDPLKPSQAARDAAGDYVLSNPPIDLSYAYSIRRGHGDEFPIVQAFARFERDHCAPAVEVREVFQAKVQPWLMKCFGPIIAGDREERNHRFLEESLELVQSLGCSASEAHQLVDYTFGREIGHPPQEVGGVMVTLAALCLANDLDMHAAGWVELDRIWGKVEQIRAKQAAKPKHSPLPAALSTPTRSAAEVREADVERGLAWAFEAGASAVHEEWKRNPGEAPRGDPEFAEAATDYAKAALDPFSSAARIPEKLARAVLTSLPPADGGWLPIESAPKDGTEFLSAGGTQGTAGKAYPTRYLSPGPYTTENGKNAEGQRRFQWPDGFYWAGWDGFVGPVDPTIWIQTPTPPPADPRAEKEMG